MATRLGPRVKTSSATIRQTSTSVGSPTQKTGPGADQQVPDGAAADPGERGQKREAERVHALARRHQRAGQGEDGNADGFEGDVLKEGHVWPAWAGGTAIFPPPCGEG